MTTIRRAKASVPGIILTALSLAIFVFALIEAQEFRPISQWFPVGVSAIGVVLALVVTLWEVGVVTWGVSESLEADATASDSESSRSPLRGWLMYMAWLVVLAAGMMVLGAVIAVPVWLFVFFHFVSKESWIRSALYALAALLVIVVLTALLHLFLPIGYLVPSGDWIPRINIRF